jgi:hypothetical protein
MNSLLVAPADGRADYGVSALPKTATSPASIKNSLEYIFRRAPCFTTFPASGRCLWKRSFFADGWPRVDPFHGQGRCFDIGTPERYRNAHNGLAAAEIEAGALRQGGGL